MALNFHKKSEREYGVELIHQTKVRWIGSLVEIGNVWTLVCRRKPEHLYRLLNAIGVNAELIDANTHNMKFDRIRVLMEGKAYEVSRRTIMMEGVKMSSGGFEMQYFLPLSYWYKMDENEYLTRADRDSRDNQLDLGV